MERKVFRVGSVGIGGISRGVHLPGIAKSPDFGSWWPCVISSRSGWPMPVRPMGLRRITVLRIITIWSTARMWMWWTSPPLTTPILRWQRPPLRRESPYCLEKPVTLTAEEADILAKMTAERGLPSMVCFSYRFKAAARYAKELVDKGLLGEIYHVYMQYLQAGGGPSYDLPRSWRYQKSLTGTGALGDLGCHALDLVSFVTGKDYCKAVGHADTFVHQRRLEEGEGMGEVDVDDFCHYLMEMDGKTSANFSVTRFAYGRGNYQRMEIYGSKGALVYSLDVTPGVDELEVCIGFPL